MNHPALRYVLLLLCLVPLMGSMHVVAQTDTLTGKEEDLKLDFGLIRDRNRHMWPLLYKHKTPDYKDVQLMFTVYRKLQRYKAGTKHQHLMPFFWADSSGAGKDLRIGTLYYPSLFRYVKDTVNKSKSLRVLELAPEISMLNITRSDNGLYTQNNLFFFIWSKNDEVTHKSQFTVFPLYWYNRNLHHTTSALVPVYRYKRQERTTHLDIYPALYLYKGDDRGSRHYLFPFIYHRSYEQTAARRAHKTVVFPLVFHHRNQKSLRFTLFPVFSVSKTYLPRTDMSYKRTVMVTPLYWQRDYSREGYRILFPLYWRHYDYTTGDSLRSTYLLPLYYNRVSSLSSSQVLFPLYWKKRNLRDTSLYVLPFYASAYNYYRRYQIWFPFYLHHYRDQTDKHTQAYTPLLWHWYTEHERNTLLFPLYYHHHDSLSSKRHVFPLFYSGHTPQHNWHTLIPLYLRYQNTDARAVTAVTPLYWHWKDAQSRNSMLLPLYFTYHDSTSSYRHLFPLFYSGKENGERWHTLLPFYYRHRFTGDTMWVSLPGFYSHKTAGFSKQVWFPLVWLSKRDTGGIPVRSRVIFPLYLRYTVGPFYRLTAVTPLFWNRRALNPQTSTTRNLNLLFPIWWSKSLVSPGNALQTQVLFPLYYAKRHNDYSHRVLFPLYWGYQNEVYRSRTLVPFYFQYRELNGAYHLQAYSPFLWRLRTPQKQSFSMVPFWWSNTRYVSNDTLKSRVLFPLYWSYRGSHHHTKVLFPLYWKFKTDSSRSVTLVPFMHASSTMVDGAPEKYVMVFPLYYAQRHKTERNITFLPLYFHHREGEDSTAERHTLLLPLYYHRQLYGDTARLFLPLVYLLRNPDFRMSVVAPFYLKHQTPESRLLALTPLYWSYRDSSLTRRMLLPLWYNELQANGNYSRGFTPLYWHYGSPQTSHHLLLPVWWSRTATDEKARLLLPLFYYHNRKQTAERTLWILPTFWQHQTAEQTNTALFPLWFHRAGTDSNSFTSTLVPLLYYRYRSAQEKHLNMLGIFHLTRKPQSATSFFIPLYLHHHRITDNGYQNLTAITPLFWHQHNKVHQTTETRNWLLPLYFTRRNVKGDSLLTYRKRVLFPLWWNVREPHRYLNLVLPVYARFEQADKQRTLTAYTPFLWVNRERQPTEYTRHINLLLLYNHHLALSTTDTLRRSSLFPLYFTKDYRSGSYEKHYRIVFPLFWHTRSTSKQTTLLLPLFLHHHRYANNRRVQAYTPLVWYISDKQHQQLVAWPLFNYRHDSLRTRFNLAYLLYRYERNTEVTSNSVLWPLVQHINGEQYRYFHIAPFWWFKRSPNMNYTSLQPFFYIQQTPEYRRTHVLWQLYSRKKVFGQRTGTSVLWYAYYHNRFDNGDKEVRFLYLLYANVKKEGNTEKALLPLYHHTTSADGEYSRSYLFGLYQQTKTAIPNTKEFYVEEKVFWVVRLRSNYEALKRRGVINSRKFKTGG